VFEGVGMAKSHLRWQPPGQDTLSVIPPSRFFYDPTKTQSYEKP
jgi:hypothetical protein